MSLVLGAIRSAIQGDDAEASGTIITTDLGESWSARFSCAPLTQMLSASAMPLLQHNLDVNSGTFVSPCSRPRPVILDWDDEALPSEIVEIHAGFDLIV